MADTTEKAQTPDVFGLTVLDINGDAAQMVSLWRDRKIVLTFLRHFG